MVLKSTNNKLTKDGTQMSLEGRQYGRLDLVYVLAEELLAGRMQQLVGLHDLALGDAGDGERHALGRLHALAHGVEGHHLEGETLHVSDEPPGERVAAYDRALLHRAAASSCKSNHTQIFVSFHGISRLDRFFI